MVFPTKEQVIALTISEFHGIQPWFETFYISSMIYAAERALLAFDRLKNTIASSEKPDPNEAFSSLQEALTHTAALSRFFRPTRQGGEIAKARANKLKAAFQIGTESPLNSETSRDLRNSLEHFDEKLDGFLVNFFAGDVVPNPIIGDQFFSDEEATSFFKMIDPRQETCVILGKKFEYGQYRCEVLRVLELAKYKDRTSSRL